MFADHSSTCKYAEPSSSVDDDASPAKFDVCKIEREIFRQVASSAHELILSQLDAVPVPARSGLFTVADYGAGDGSSSLPLMRKLIKQLRDKHGEQLEIQIVYEDREDFDFTWLFKKLYDGDTYIKEFDKVFPMVTNTNFNKQCVPSNSCDVIYTSFANYFVSNCPVQFKDTMFYMTSTNQAELGPFLEAAAKYWQDYLLLRAKELKPGGVLVVLNPCGREGKDPGTGREGLENSSQLDPYMDMEQAWNHLRHNSVITEDEWKSCSMPEIYRTKRQTTAPMEEVGSPVHQAGLRVLYYDEVVIPCDIKSLWRQKKESGTTVDTGEFADQQTAYHKETWADGCFRNFLAASRSEEEKSAILDQLFANFRQRVLGRDLESYRTECLVARLVVQKIVH